MAKRICLPALLALAFVAFATSGAEAGLFGKKSCCSSCEPSCGCASSCCEPSYIGRAWCRESGEISAGGG